MIFNVSRKDLNEAIKWSKKNSPIAYLVLSMNGKWGVPGENPVNIVAAFKRLWPETRSYLKTMATMNYSAGGKIDAAKLDINYPLNRVKPQIRNDFLLMLKNMSKYMDEAEDYEAMESYCRDMIDIFVWVDDNRDIWNGSIAYALDKQGRYEDAYQFYTSIREKGPLVASMYALSLLERIELERAEEVLEPYRRNTDKVVSDRIMLLDRLKKVKALH